jgi:hypothetical protein
VIAVRPPAAMMWPASSRASRAPFAASEGRYHDLSNSSTTAARDALLDAGHIIAAGGRTAITDPLLADWILRELP